MNGYLRQSTASQARAIGPFVDDTDFKTAETGLTIANTDVKLRANGTSLSNKNSGGGTHQVNGLYSLTFDATDTANVGELQFSVVVSGALPVFGTYVVLEEAVYDALFAASAPGYVTDQPVNATKFAGQTIAAAAGVTLPSTVASPTNITAGTITTVTNLTNAATSGDLTATMKTSVTTAATAATPTAAAVTGAVGSVTGAVGSVTGNVGGNVTGSVGSVVGAVGSVTGAVGSVTGNVGGNVTGSIGSLATQAKADVNAEADTSLADYDAPTHTELTAELATADDAVLAAIAALNNLSQANIRSAVGLGSANLDTQLGDLPTNSELATALAAADDAVLSAISALSIPTAAATASAILAAAYEGSETFQQFLRIARAALVGKANGFGAAGATAGHFRSAADDKNRLTVVTDEFGNRSTVTTDVS